MHTNAYQDNFTLSQKMVIYGGVFLFTGVIPAIVVLLGMVSGKISDGFISHREQRTVPYLVSMVSYCVAIYFVLQQGLGFWVAILLSGATASLILIFVINFFWKISAHMAGIGGLTAGIFACSIVFQINPVGVICASILVSLLLAFSRLYLKAHTLGQVICGYCLGFICVFTPYFFLYNIG